jgi:4-carboxymuconolactone decarboxylase
MTETRKLNTRPSGLSYEDVRTVSPALEHYTKGPLLDGLWKRQEMSLRDRSIVTVAALIARIQTIEMPFYFALALDNGVKPSELSEIITHLAFYSGWANAMSAVAVAKDIFHQRGIGIDQLPSGRIPLGTRATIEVVEFSSSSRPQLSGWPSRTLRSELYYEPGGNPALTVLC